MIFFWTEHINKNLMTQWRKKEILFSGAWPGEELPLQPVRQELQGAPHVETSPQNPQLRVP